MMATKPNFTLKQKEAKTLRFTIRDKLTGAVVDVSSATLTFAGQKQVNPDGLDITKADGTFGKVDAENGIVTLPLSASDLDLDAEVYECELKVEFSASNIDKSTHIELTIEEAITT
jgi:hypothetical protein